jgi:AcrR family transcriptional regulator
MASTRQGLLSAGRKLFSDRGLYESRVEEITEMADVGKGTLYRYFRNKEALVLAVVEAGFADLRQRVAARTDHARDFDAAIEAIAEAHVGFFADNPDLMRIFHQVRGMLKFDRPEWRPLAASLEGHLEFLAGTLRRLDRGSRAGRARHRDLAGLLFGGVSGALSVHVAVDPRAEIASMRPLLVAALKGMARPFVASDAGRRSSRAGSNPALRPGRRGDR